ncbi:hypothetical protein GCM10022244_08660 [Streptomyces gulbargensis]|uniref:Uncharacterized protein n=1 Tax=Streptomyces gulbargensis TaxID=364901 RepID=A0ABP7LJR3_9ACTN
MKRGAACAGLLRVSAVRRPATSASRLPKREIRTVRRERMRPPGETVQGVDARGTRPDDHRVPEDRDAQ